MKRRPKIRSIVALTGAGISAESGIRTFRDSGGLWENHRIEDVASPDGFARNPKLVQTFYNARRAQLDSPGVAPNPAHEALAKLEREFPGAFLLVTQNVDDLHDRAGNRKLLHMHGELRKMRCSRSNAVFPIASDITDSLACACCKKTGTLRPHIVWFGEIPLYMDEIKAALSDCDLFLAIGTSSVVYPAAMFMEIAKANGRAWAVEVNLEATEKSRRFDDLRHGPASRELPKLIDEILAGSYP